MRFSSNPFATWTTACTVLAFYAAQVSAAYFLVNDPQPGTQWVNNAANLVTWEKGLLDGINGFDVELARMSQDGLTLVARNVPVQQKKLNIMLQDVPAGDDYFLIFINSTHGVMHATSQRFAILAAAATPTATRAPPAAGVPTVSVSGAPNPTMQFATTFPAIASGALPSLLTGQHINGLLLTAIGVVFGAAFTVGW